MKLVNFSFILLLSCCEKLTAFASELTAVTLSNRVLSLDDSRWNYGQACGPAKNLTSWDALDITSQIQDRVEKTAYTVAVAQAEGIKDIDENSKTVCELPSTWYPGMTDEDKADIRRQMNEVERSSVDLNIIARIVKPPSEAYHQEAALRKGKKGSGKKGSGKKGSRKKGSGKKGCKKSGKKGNSMQGETAISGPGKK
eukprot:15337512-Ditylum_brightwellii.AAC.1